MDLSAEYSGRKACPKCNRPARRVGRWYTANGEWMFQKQSVAVEGPRGERRERDWELWENFPATAEVTDQRTGFVQTKKRDQWFRIAHFECSGGLHDESESCGYFHEVEMNAYKGPFYDWMLAPSAPGTPGDAITGAAVELAKAWGSR